MDTDFVQNLNTFQSWLTRVFCGKPDKPQRYGYLRFPQYLWAFTCITNSTQWSDSNGT
jgi:hypothetical protein